MQDDSAVRRYDVRPKRTWLQRVCRALSPTRLARRIRSNWWKEILPFLVAFGFFLWAYWFNSVMQVESQRRQNYIERSLRDPFGSIYSAPYQQQDNPNAHEHTRQQSHVGKHHEDELPEPPEPQPSPDFFFYVLPFIRFWIICDILAVTLMVLLILKFSFLSRCKLRMVLKRFFLIQGLLFLLRALSIYLTSQQLPLTTCVSTIHKNSAAYEAIFIMVGLRRTCADLLFSGHTAFFTLGFLLIWTYSFGEEWQFCCGRRWKRQKLEEMRLREEDAATARAALASAGFASMSAFQASESMEEGTAAQAVSSLPASPPAASDPHSELFPLAPLSPAETALDAADRVHESLAHDHPWFLPVLNSAGDPDETFTLSAILMLLYLFVGMFFIVSTHFHYSVDVLIGLLIAVFTFHGYHATLRTLHERRSGDRIKRFLSWIEDIPPLVGGEVGVTKEKTRKRKAKLQTNPPPPGTLPLPLNLPLHEAIASADALVSHGGEVHSYVYYSVTRNCYRLKRVSALEARADAERAAAVAAKLALGRSDSSSDDEDSDYDDPDGSPSRRGLLSDGERKDGGRRLSQAELRASEDAALAKEEARSRYLAMGADDYMRSPLK